MNSESFAENCRTALVDVKLQSAMSKATEKFIATRKKAEGDDVSEWHRLRDRAREIKEHTIAHLDYYLGEFAAKVEGQGGRVFWATDAEEARRYVVELATGRRSRLVVKGKSMMSEEIGLNPALAAAGIEAVETDLGEYIVQMAGERPSHINMPAVHKTRGDVADLFTEKLRVGRTEEIAELTALARGRLRGRFAAAEVGITGVNFAVAETGTIVLVENEGNIRLSASLPRVHVALMGIEKVVPRLEDLDVFLKVLPRSASGQLITASVSFLTGVKSAPEELHVVIIDNGRTEMLANPHLRESLFCIRCGACLNACPVYQKIGGHAYGWVYPGPIGVVLTPGARGRHLPTPGNHSLGAFDWHSWERLVLTAREKILGRVRAALGREASAVSPERLPPFRSGADAGGTDAEKLARFCSAVESAGGHVARPASGEEVKAHLEALLAREGQAAVAVSDGATAVSLRLREWLEAKGLLSLPTLGEFVSAGAREASDAGRLDETPDGDANDLASLYRQRLMSAGVGIASAEFGIAETGTLVLVSGREQHRLISLLPAVHVCLLDPARVVRDMSELLARVRAESFAERVPPRAATFITGPSCTADIEQTLTQGMHGPRELHVLLYSAMN